MTWIVTRPTQTIFLPSRLSISWLCYKSLFRNLRIHCMTWFVIRLVLSDNLFGGEIVWVCHMKDSNLTRIKQRWAISHSYDIWMFHTCECVLSLQQKYNSSRLTSRRWLWGLSVSVCCSVMQCVAVCCSVLQYVAARCNFLQCVDVWCSVLQCSAVWCGVMWCVAVCCSVLQCGAVCCSVL